MDHVYTNQLHLCSKVEVVELKLSDHKPLKFTLVQKWKEEQTRHVFSPLGRWQCPHRFTDDEWTEHLEKAWAQHREVPRLNHLSKDVDVDIEWKLFNRILHDMFHSVQKEFGNPEDPPTGFKGDNVKIKQIAKRVCLDLGDMKSRKRRNWIARAETFLQKVQLHPQFTHSKEYMVLKRKLGNHDIPALKAQIETLASEEQSYRNAMTQARISKCKLTVLAEHNG